jgi:membrane peptidoglycan carboxypeptidase
MYHPPRLALHYIGTDGKPEPIARPAEARGETRVMSEAAARTLLQIMQGVTEDGTAKLAAIPGYPVAGKTGTAQKVTNGRYDPSKYLASFVGIVPADKPRLVVAVMIDEPQGTHYGGLIAAPAFKTIAEAALRYLGVPPSEPVQGDKNGNKKSSKSAPKQPVPVDPVDNEIDGPGVDEPAAVVATEEGGDSADATFAEDDEMPAGSNGASAVPVPDFTGMSIGEAIRAARKAGIELIPSGSGLGVAQSPKPGLVGAGTVCRVSFQRGGV